MRIVLIIASVLVLAGCSLFNGPRPYDPVEYGMIVDFTVDTTRAIHLCNNPSKVNTAFWGHVQDANEHSLRLDEFESNRGGSIELAMAVGFMREMVNDILIRGNFSVEYCTEKLTNIQASSRIISRVLGQSDQHGFCDGGIRERYDLFTKSYTDKKITLSEYKELVADVARLENVDTTGCSQETKQKHLQDLNALEKVVPIVMAL